MIRKHALSAIMMAIGLVASVKAQTTVTYTLNAADEDATIDDYVPGRNNPNEIEYCSGTWTIGGTPVTWRNLFRFNLSCIPSNATIEDARLSLYFATQNNFGDTAHSSLTHSDESVVQRVTGTWTETSVNWNNQPTTTPTDEVLLPQSVTGTDDYLNLNVTAMVQQMVSAPTFNYGFMLKATNETPYARMFFSSGDNPDSSKHPTLTITYTIPATNCLTLSLDSSSQDASIDDYFPTRSNPNEIEYCTGSWTIQGTPVIWRDLFLFPIPCELSNMQVTHAGLSLYYASQNNFGNVPHSNLTHSDESVIQRVTAPWSETAVNWNNQPPTTTLDQVYLPQSVTGTDDYLNLDVTLMVRYMVEHPDSSFGFLVKGVNETPYARMFLASGDNPDAARHPRLEICYSPRTAIDGPQEIRISPPYPNPTTGILRLQGDFSNVISIRIINALGETIEQKPIDTNSPEITIDLSSHPAGIYHLQIYSAYNRVNYRIAVNR